MIKILLLGSTGLLGGKVLEKLLESGSYETAILIRDLEKRKSSLDQLKDKVKFFDGNLLVPATLNTSFRWADIIINCSGLVSYQKKDRKALYKINQETVGSIVSLCSGFSKQLIHISSGAVYGYSATPKAFQESEISETSVKQTRSAYFLSKYEADLEVQKAQCKKIILRPGSLISQKSSSLGKLYHLFQKGISLDLPGGASFIWVNNVADAVIKSIDRILNMGPTDNWIYNLGGENISYRDINLYFIKHFNKKPLKLSPLLLNMAGWYSDAIMGPFTGKSVLPRELLEITRNYCYLDSTQAFRDLNFEIKPCYDVIEDLLIQK